MSSFHLAGRVSHPIGIGTWDMGNTRSETEDARCIAAVRRSLDAGQDHIDTAEMYGSGHTEEIVGVALQGRPRASYTIASKLWRDSRARDRVRPAVEAMLQRLRLDHLDLLYIHADWPGVPLAETLGAMDELVDAGLIGSLGLSNFQLPRVEEAQRLARHPIVALQNRYNVLYRRDVPADLFEHCRTHDIVVVAYQPVERGQVADDAAVRDVAERREATAAQVAIAWLLRQEGVMAIPKAVSAAHIEENLAATGLQLDDDDLHVLDGAKQID